MFLLMRFPPAGKIPRVFVIGKLECNVKGVKKVRSAVQQTI